MSPLRLALLSLAFVACGGSQGGGHDMHAADLSAADFAMQLPHDLAGADLASIDASNGDASGPMTYTTSFPLTENPISESAHWINGGTTGIDWGNVQTTPGLAHGAVVSGGPPYNDSTAVLSGTWGSEQTAEATVHTVNRTTAIRSRAT